MFSDGNFSYGIEPVGSGEVSQHCGEVDQQVGLVVNTHLSVSFSIKPKQKPGQGGKIPKKTKTGNNILPTVSISLSTSHRDLESRQRYSISKLLYGKY